MPSSIIVVLAIESILIVFTTLLLVRPAFLFRDDAHQRKRKVALWLGVLFLGVTFCWSVLVGVLIRASEGLSL